LTLETATRAIVIHGSFASPRILAINWGSFSFSLSFRQHWLVLHQQVNLVVSAQFLDALFANLLDLFCGHGVLRHVQSAAVSMENAVSFLQ